VKTVVLLKSNDAARHGTLQLGWRLRTSLQTRQMSYDAITDWAEPQVTGTAAEAFTGGTAAEAFTGGPFEACMRRH